MLGLPIGTRVRFTADISYCPYATIRAGEEGVVSQCDPEISEDHIQLDKFHLGLAEYDNQVWVNSLCAYVADYIRAVLPIPTMVDERQINACHDGNTPVLVDVLAKERAA
jgi:hypothetical protein